MNPDDKEETKMKTKMKVAVCTLLCMTLACAAANAEGGTTTSPNCLKSAAVWMKRSSRACSMRV